MKPRGTRRFSGAIDETLGETVTLPMTLPWVTGRFYGCSMETGAATGTGTSTVIRAKPIYIPQPITISTIGCEVTIVGAAGTVQRCALYRNDPEGGVPAELVIDSGTIAVDASTGFLSATVTTPVTPGWYWLAHTANGGTFRVYANQKGLNWVYDAVWGELTGNGYVLWLNAAIYSTQVILTGWPRAWWRFGWNSFEMVNSTMPRVLLGV